MMDLDIQIVDFIQGQSRGQNPQTSTLIENESKNVEKGDFKPKIENSGNDKRKWKKQSILLRKRGINVNLPNIES